MPYLEALVKYAAGTPLSALDTHGELCELMTYESSAELISAWAAYDLATRPGTSYCVVPPRGLSDPSRAKAPVGLGPRHEWKQWQTERPDDALLWQWYIEEGRKGVGLVLGAVSDGLHCLDWEGRAVESGFLVDCTAAIEQAGLGEEWARISAYAERTPSGGVHHFYRLATPRKKSVLAKSESGEVFLEDLGQGEYVLVAPSHEVSEKGTYTPVPSWPADLGEAELTQDMDVTRTIALEQLFEGHLFLEGPMMSADVIDSIHAVIQRTARARGLVTPPPVWEQEYLAAQEAARRGATPMVRGKAQRTAGANTPHVGELLKSAPGITDTVVGWLEQLGWRRTAGTPAHNGAVAVTRPGADKSASDVSGLVGGRDTPGMFYCFTSSSTHFEDGKQYTPLWVYAIAAHHGDVGAATRDLERRLGITRHWGGARA